MLGANTNMWAFVETAVDLNAKGFLGELYLLEAEYVHDIRWLMDLTPWREFFPSIKYCTHSLGPLLRVLNEDLVSVSCFGSGSHINRRQGQDDAMIALFRTPSDVVVRVLVTFINQYPTWGHRYRLWGTKGYFERTPAYEGEGSGRTVFFSTELYGEERLVELPTHHIRPEHMGLEKARGHGGADYALLERFFDAVRAGGPSPIGLREALAMTLPGIYAAESAARGGELVEIRYPWT
jgi:predicted dehydrogenase